MCGGGIKLKEKNIFFRRLFCPLKSLIYECTNQEGDLNCKNKKIFKALSLMALIKRYITVTVYIFSKVVIKYEKKIPKSMWKTR